MNFIALTNFYHNGMLIERGSNISLENSLEINGLLMLGRIAKVSEKVVERQTQQVEKTTRKK